MTANDFFKLSEMLHEEKVLLKLSRQTHRYILAVNFSDDPDLIPDQSLPYKLNGIQIDYTSLVPFKEVHLAQATSKEDVVRIRLE